jgi:hypothetical protein
VRSQMRPFRAVAKTAGQGKMIGRAQRSVGHQRQVAMTVTRGMAAMLVAAAVFATFTPSFGRWLVLFGTASLPVRRARPTLRPTSPGALFLKFARTAPGGMQAGATCARRSALAATFQRSCLRMASAVSCQPEWNLRP